MTYKEIVTLIKTIAEAINPDGSYFHGRTYDTTLEFGAVYPQVHLYPFTMQPEQSNYNIIRSELLIAFWKEDGHENTMEQREDIIAEMDDLCVLFEAAIRATENVQVLSFRKEPQYLSQMGVVSGIACNISLHSAVLCVAPSDQAPVNLTLPLITGLNTLGATLSGSNGTWSGNPDTFTFTYQWKRDGVNISGATNNTYVTTVLDSEADITFEVTANNGVSPNGVATSLGVTMADYTPVNTLAPAISGSTSLGSTLTTTNGSWTNSPSIFSYQWKRNGVNISGATNSNYVTVVADSTATITCEVTASNGLVDSQISNSLIMADYTPVNTVSPAVTGSAVVGQTLSTTNGTWTNSPSTFTYQWYRGVTPIGTNSNAYTLVQDDAGNTSNIYCEVTATNAAGSASADSNTIAQIMDANAQAYMQAVSIANNSTVYFASTAQERTGAQLYSYYNTFYIGLKSNSLFAKILVAYRERWGVAASNRVNLVNPATFLMTYSGTLSYNITGTAGNGTNGIGNTGFIPDSNGLTVNNNHICIYSRTAAANPVANQFYEAGSGNATGTVLGTIFTRRSTNLAGYDSGNFTNNRASYSSTDGSGIYIGKVNSDLTSKLFRNGVQVATRAITSQPSLSTYNDYVHGFNELGTNTSYSPKEMAYYSRGTGMSDAEVAIYNGLIAYLNTAEGI